MTRTQKQEWFISIAFGFGLAVLFFIAGMFDGIDKAIDAQEQHNRLSVYCQQYGAIETLCNSLHERN